jgi:hypothetical protein
MPLPYRSTHTRTILGRLLITGLIVVSRLWRAHPRGVVDVPSALNPFAPLDVTEEPGWLTNYKLSRLERDALECRTVLGGSSIVSTPVPDQVTGEGCGFSNAVDVERSSVRFNSRFPATCPLAVSWAMFELHVLQPAAQQHWASRSCALSISAPIPAVTCTIARADGAASMQQQMPST